ncbi:Alpha/Beta hydrolase protein [Chiua virens]|nr:Alpha/Beta hydrolase protein [Chiua virens]
MRVLNLLPLVFASTVLASYIPDAQVVLGDTWSPIRDAASGLRETLLPASNNAGAKAYKWADGKSFVQEHGLMYELVQHPHFSNHQLRITEPTLCDPSVKQYSGYLDVTDDKHLFFWFFEARNSPENAPLVMWLNGGPGCSSSTGLLFELGPCRVTDNGTSTTLNPYSWNTNANIIFLDQPVDVGYSYVEDGSKVDTSPVAGQDVYAFLQLFLNRFPEYASLPFHLAAESYGGTYAPNIASVIHNENKKAPFTSSANTNNALLGINLASVMLGNGMTDNYIQMASIPDYLCEGPYPIYDDPEGPQCQALRTKVPTCQTLTKACYDYNSRFVCVPAALYCNTQLYAPIQQSGLNPYDARRPCDRSKDGPLCYQEMSWVETYLNQADVKAALGVNPQRNFESCNMAVNQAFTFQGDSMHNTPALLPPLINDGVRLLVYAGNADMMCNYIGNERWLEVLETDFLDEFTVAPTKQWITLGAGKVAGTVRSASGGGFSAGNITFVTVHEAGHMVPFDQPEAALDMFTRWIVNIPLAF